MRRLHDATIGALHPSKVITVSHSMKADLDVSSFSTSYNGKTLMSFGPRYRQLTYICTLMLQNQVMSITIHCDNIAIVYALNSQTSKNKRVVQLLRHLIVILLINNIRFQALHIPGKKNILCDKLSRQQMTPSLLKVFRMEPLPVPVPVCLLPHSCALLRIDS